MAPHSSTLAFSGELSKDYLEKGVILSLVSAQYPVICQSFGML